MNIAFKIEKAANLLSSHAVGTLKKNKVNAFWWSGVKNFGDSLTPELFSKFGKTAINTKAEKASYVGVGSILHLLPKTYSGTILGSGCIRNENYALKYAKFAFVRGEFTKKALCLPSSTETGDLGLLAPHLLTSRDIKRFDIGLIPHYVDKKHEWIRQATDYLGSKGTLIDVQASAEDVINQIHQCDFIISSSLHGLIVADALGIPNIWLKLSDKVSGGRFKFDDYNSSIDYEQDFYQPNSLKYVKTPEKFSTSKSHNKIREKQELLFRLLTQNLNGRRGYAKTHLPQS